MQFGVHACCVSVFKGNWLTVQLHSQSWVPPPPHTSLHSCSRALRTTVGLASSTLISLYCLELPVADAQLSAATDSIQLAWKHLSICPTPRNFAFCSLSYEVCSLGTAWMQIQIQSWSTICIWQVQYGSVAVASCTHIHLF